MDLQQWRHFGNHANVECGRNHRFPAKGGAPMSETIAEQSSQAAVPHLQMNASQLIAAADA